MNIPICFIGSDETVNLLGTKATVSDLEFRHYKELTIIRPISFPDKFKTLVQAVNLSEYVVIELSEVDKFFGEIIILLDLLKKKGEFIVSVEKQYLIDQVKSILKNTSLDYEFRIIKSNDDIKELKQDLLKIKPRYGDKPLVIIDHFFNVKNIGTVALGFIKGGSIKVKDKFTLLPGGKSIQINSMQSMDVDYKELNVPARVGVSLKNCGIEDLERGSVLTQDLQETTEFKGELIKTPYHKSDVSKAMIINGLIARQATINDKVVLDKPITLLGDTIVYDDNMSPRVIGIIHQ